MRRSKVPCAALRRTIVTTALVLASLYPAMAGAQCPGPDKLKVAFDKLFKKTVEVIRVKPSAVSGLCEVQFRLDGRSSVIYSDPEGDFLFAGQLLDVQNQRNLTQEVMMELNRMSAEDLERLDALTAFTSGNSGKVVYFATDPECPYCKKGHEILTKMAQEGKLTVKYLFFPLPMHEMAEKQCVAILCDNKGIQGLEQGYNSANQCPEGIKKVQDTVAFLKAKGISATPVYIFDDGVYHTGVLPEEMLLQRLNPSKQADTEAPSQPKP